MVAERARAGIKKARASLQEMFEAQQKKNTQARKAEDLAWKKLEAQMKKDDLERKRRMKKAA